MSCPGTPAITFNPTNWKARYPVFAAVNDGVAQLYFNEATLYCANQINPVPNTDELTTLLNMLTAHVAWLAGAGTNNGSSSGAGPVGRLSNAAEGSVNVAFENLFPPGTAQWYQQTQFGAAYWAATAKYRTMRYRSGIRRGLSLSQVPWQYPNGGQ